VRNLAALSFVVVVLGACGTYTYQNTHHPRQSLMREMPASSWDSYVRRGGAFQ
jgi:hypothetical protein